jgi:hypothetical protein
MINKKEFIRIISASVLGDGGLYIAYTSKNPNAYFAFSQIDEHQDYIDWFQGILEEVTSVRIRKVTPERGRNYTVLTTKTNPIYTNMFSRLYLNRKRVIDPHYLKLFDWKSLAFLYMDDGSLLYGKTATGGKTGGIPKYPTNQIKLYTNAFSYAENFFLKKFLKETFDLEFNINQKNGKFGILYYLNLRSKDFEKFVNGITPHVFPSFFYKLELLEKYRTIDSEKSDDEMLWTSEESEELVRNELVEEETL